MSYKKIGGDATSFPGLSGFFPEGVSTDEDQVSEISPIKVRRIHIVAADCGSGDATLIATSTFGGEYILGAFLRVTTAEVTGSTKTIDLGVETDDADGFVDGGSIAAKGAVSLTCALACKILTSGKKLSITVPNALTEFVGDLYIIYVEA